MEEVEPSSALHSRKKEQLEPVADLEGEEYLDINPMK